MADLVTELTLINLPQALSKLATKPDDVKSESYVLLRSFAKWRNDKITRGVWVKIRKVKRFC